MQTGQQTEHRQRERDGEGERGTESELLHLQFHARTSVVFISLPPSPLHLSTSIPSIVSLLLPCNASLDFRIRFFGKQIKRKVTLTMPRTLLPVTRFKDCSSLPCLVPCITRIRSVRRRRRLPRTATFALFTHFQQRCCIQRWFLCVLCFPDRCLGRAQAEKVNANKAST